MSQRDKVKRILEHPDIAFYINQKVKMKEEHERTNRGNPISGYVSSIKIDENGIWYEVLYSPLDGSKMSFKTIYLLEGFLEELN